MKCITATELVEKEKVSTLTFNEKLKLSWHLGMCVPCRKYKAYSNQVDELLEEAREDKKALTLSQTKKEAIINALKKGWK